LATTSRQFELQHALLWLLVVLDVERLLPMPVPSQDKGGGGLDRCVGILGSLMDPRHLLMSSVYHLVVWYLVSTATLTSVHHLLLLCANRVIYVAMLEHD
jgi:hypothetical protein